MQDQNMAMFQQLLQNPQVLQRLQDPAVRGQLAQQLAGQFQAPPPEAANGWNVQGQPPMGLSNPQQSLPQPPQGQTPAQAPGGMQPTPFLQGLTTPLGSGVPVQFDRNGAAQTPFLPVAAPNQAPSVPVVTGGVSPSQGQAHSAFQQTSALIPGGVPQGQGGGLDQASYISEQIRQLQLRNGGGGFAGSPFVVGMNSPMAI